MPVPFLQMLVGTLYHQDLPGGSICVAGIKDNHCLLLNDTREPYYIRIRLVAIDSITVFG